MPDSDIVMYELTGIMIVAGKEYGNRMLLNHQEGKDMTDILTYFAQSMDRQFLDTCGRVLPSRTWTCRAITKGEWLWETSISA